MLKFVSVVLLLFVACDAQGYGYNDGFGFATYKRSTADEAAILARINRLMQLLGSDKQKKWVLNL